MGTHRKSKYQPSRLDMHSAINQVEKLIGIIKDRLKPFSSGLKEYHLARNISASIEWLRAAKERMDGPNMEK